VKSVFSGKNIVVGVTGSIAAFKVAGWVSDLAKEEAMVRVVMTESAEKFVTPLTFAALSQEKVYTKMFDPRASESMAHIDLGREADLIIIAPATANTIARLAHGFADDLISTLVLASRSEVLIFPAMNSSMYSHRATRLNLKKLQDLGYKIVDPDSGMMACKEEGEGRLVEWETAKEEIAGALSKQDLSGHRILITAGPTRETIDPARFLSNRSSGKMGYALAACASRRGASVTLISGPGNLQPPVGASTIKVETALEMYEAVMTHSSSSNVIIKAAAVADYRPEESALHKVKKEEIETRLQLIKNPDILMELGQKKLKKQILVGFAAESRNLLNEGRRKLQQKNLDLIAVNDISSSEAGFEVDNNQVLLIDADGEQSLPFSSKSDTADLILDKVVELVNKKG
jgi:phosphopantothenoylcysteine decarboxylase/phosphopantothenate--cysteine ligase